MPAINTVRTYATHHLYHVYNRGAHKQEIFRGEEDYAYMLYLLKRSLSAEEMKDSSGRPFTKYTESVELVSFCLMPNHFHFLLYLKGEETTGIEKFMRSVMTAYSMYFNMKYKHSGTIFQGPYKASAVLEDSYYTHIGRYIHLNPLDVVGHDYLTYPFSSIHYFMNRWTCDWVKPERILEDGHTPKRYEKFLKDYEEYSKSLKQLKSTLAG